MDYGTTSEKIDNRDSMAKWTWIVDRGSVADREPKDQACTGYD